MHCNVLYQSGTMYRSVNTRKFMYRLIIALYLMSVLPVTGQEVNSIYVFKDGKYLTSSPIDLTDADTLDMAQFVAHYTLSYQKYKQYRLPREDDKMTLLVGMRYTKFYPDILLSIDEGHTKSEDKIHAMDANSPKLWTSYYDKEKREMTSEHRMPFVNAYLISYTEPALTIEWKLSEETQTIMGYTCQKATGLFRGRMWIVWFAPELPLDAYLWNLGGLPGLILKAETDMCRFACTSLSDVQCPILRPKCKYRVMTRAKWRQLEKGYHASPYDAFNDGGQNEFYDGTFKLTKENWTIEYNPIELE